MLSSFLVSNVVIRCHLRASSSQRCKAGGKWQKSWHFRTLESCSKTALAVEVKMKEAIKVNASKNIMIKYQQLIRIPNLSKIGLCFEAHCLSARGDILLLKDAEKK